MERRALGKGIGALIPDKEPEGAEKVHYVSLEQIRPNPFQPREHFDSQGMEDLVRSIKEKGVIQPVLVRRKGDYYELIAGERRWRAAKSLSLSEIPVIVKNIEDQDSLEISLIENIQRQDLNPIEEARAYRYLIEKFGITQDRLSDVLGKARTSVANVLRLLKLAPEVQEEIKRGRLTFAHGRTLLEIEDQQQQRKLAQEIICNSLSVRELETIVKSQRPQISRRRITLPADPDAYVAVLEETLRHALATKVRINKKKKRGTIIIEFYSQEDLDRIVTKIRSSATA